MDVQVLEAINTKVADFDRLDAYKALLLASSYLAAKLFSSNVAITPDTQLSALTEADFAGYAPIVVTGLNGPYIGPDGLVYLATDLLLYLASGAAPGNSIYAAGLVISTGAAATATVGQSGGAVVAPVTITSGGAGYEIPPKVVITDATIGTGATAHAVITGGVVTDIIIDTPGSGYTGPIVTIEEPVKLIEGGNFSAPLPMTVATDAIPLVFQLDQGG